MFYNNCPINEQTADGKTVGRCWYYCYDGVCPRHGNVIKEIEHYKKTGWLTLESKHDNNNGLRRNK